MGMKNAARRSSTTLGDHHLNIIFLQSSKSWDGWGREAEGARERDGQSARRRSLRRRHGPSGTELISGQTSLLIN